MTLLNRLIDKLQETFPPNRIVVLLTPIAFMPVAATVTAWVATHFPGLELDEGIIIGLAGGAALAALTLAYKWLDQWQRGEDIATQADLEEALVNLEDGPDVQDLFHVLGTLEGVGRLLGNLRTRLDSAGDQIPDAEVSAELAPILDAIGATLHEHSERRATINAAVPVE